MRKCSRCREEKPASAFGKDRSKRDGLTCYCTPCYRKIRKIYRTRMRKPCEVCGEVGFVTRGMCKTHYDRALKHGTPGPAGKFRPRRGCKEPGCLKPHDSRGWCDMHYERVRRNGTPGSPHPLRRPKTCLVPRCERPHEARGLCHMHYQRWRTKNKIGPTGTVFRKKCTVPMCGGKHHARGMCKLHYDRQWYNNNKKAAA